MIITTPDLIALLLTEITRLRADLRSADQANILMAEELEWHKGRHELLQAGINPRPAAGGRR